MAEPPDMNELAKRYLDLWQEHLTLTASDPETMDALGRIIDSLSAWAPGPGGLPGVPVPGGPFAWGSTPEHGTRTAEPSTETQTGPAAAASASDDGDGGADFLNRRVARLEDRIAELESQLAGQSGSASGRAEGR